MKLRIADEKEPKPEPEITLSLCRHGCGVAVRAVLPNGHDFMLGIFTVIDEKMWFRRWYAPTAGDFIALDSDGLIRLTDR